MKMLPVHLHPKCAKGFIFFAVAALVCFELGNAIKEIVAKSIHGLQSFNNPFFSFVTAKNTGGAFSVFENSTSVLAVFGVIALIATIFYVYKKLTFANDKIELLACVLFFAGVLGNTVERFQNGYVFDYIKLNFIEFPVFNFFDIAISAAVVLYALFVIFGEKFFAKKYHAKKG